METQPKVVKTKTKNRRSTRELKESPAITKAGNPVIFVTVEEHQELINEKISQIISLENGLRANESLTKQLRLEINDQRNIHNKLSKELKELQEKLNRIPNWIKSLFNAA